MAAKAKRRETPPPRKRPWPVEIAVVALLAWYYISAVSAIAGKSTTFDEVFHLTGGYSYWKLGDFRMQPENGNLPQRWAALPLLFSNTHFPDLDQEPWRNSATPVIAEQFFYNVGNNADAMLFRGRAMIALFGVALGAIVFFCMRNLLGTGPALVSLGLYAFCPSVLTNGALITSDMAAALFFTASMLCIWRVLHRVDWVTLLSGSLVMGGLFLAKFGAFMIVPMGLVLVALQLTSRQPTVVTFRGKTWNVVHRRWRLPLHVATIAVHAIVVFAVIWAFYNFRFEMFKIRSLSQNRLGLAHFAEPSEQNVPVHVSADGSGIGSKKLQANEAGEMIAVDKLTIPWSEVTQGTGLAGEIIARMRNARVLPEAYLYGFAYTLKWAQRRSAFLNGEYSVHGWPQFFPYCLLVKTPLWLFVLLALAAAAVVRGWRLAGKTWRAQAAAMWNSLYRTAPMWTLFVVYWSFAIASHLNIGHRHILPTYPPMLMFAGASWLWTARRTRPAPDSGERDARRAIGAWRLAEWPKARRWPILATIVLVSLGLFAAESLWRWPNYLAYFNPLVGGPWYGNRHLIDSSLDWGQDLPALKKWLVKEGLNDSQSEKTYLSYFGTGNPTYYGIKATILPCFFERAPPRIPEPLEPGTYCISATMLQNVYSPFRGHWNGKYEEAYQKLASNVRRFSASSTEGRNQLVATEGQAFWAQVFGLYEQARLARLTSLLRHREPDAEINYSILIYRLSALDLSRALDGEPFELEEVRGPGDR